MEQSNKNKINFFIVLKPYLYFAGFFIGLALIIKFGLSKLSEDYHNPTTVVENTTKPEQSETRLISNDSSDSKIDSQKIHHRTNEKTSAENIGYLTNQMDLTTEEAQLFWPVYNAYQKELENYIAETDTIIDVLNHDKGELSDKTIEDNLDRLITIETEKSTLKTKYHKEFKKILPKEKIKKLYLTEYTFKHQNK